MGIQKDIINAFRDKGTFSLKEAYKVSIGLNHSIRARIYEGIGIHFKKVSKGMYIVLDNGVIVIEGNGRDLSFLGDESISLLCTDSPWLDEKANTGGDRNFCNSYQCFLYEQEDFNEKFRVLKSGHFLIEMLPTEKETNFKYLHSVKLMAEEAGFKYFTKTIWKKGRKPYNTGRNMSNLLDIIIFSKGRARELRPDAKKTKALGIPCKMSGATAIVPSILDYEPPRKSEVIHQAEKPVELLMHLLELFSLEGELCLDQFSGSGSFGEACINKNRECILIELLNENVIKIKNRLGGLAND